MCSERLCVQYEWCIGGVSATAVALDAHESATGSPIYEKIRCNYQIREMDWLLHVVT